MYNWLYYLNTSEDRRRELLLNAEARQLVQEAMRAHEGYEKRSAAHRRLAAALGRQLSAWGDALQQYDDYESNLTPAAQER
jgi:hypothetical protein